MKTFSILLAWTMFSVTLGYFYAQGMIMAWEQTGGNMRPSF